MDLYPKKKPVMSVTATRKRSGFASKDNGSHETEFCNRIGCNGRLKYSKNNTLIGFTGKVKLSSSSTSKENNGITSGGVSRRDSSLSIGTDLPQSNKLKHRLDDKSLKQTGFQTKNKGSSSSNSSSSASSTMLPNSELGIRKNNIGIRSNLRNNPQNKSASDNIQPRGGLNLNSNITTSRKRVFKDKNMEGESSRDVKLEDRLVSRNSRHTRNLSSSTVGTFTTARSLRSTVSQTRMTLSSRESTRVNRPSVASSTEESRRVPSQNISVRNVPNIPSFTSLELGIPHDRQRRNLDGFAEILMSFERMGQGAELTYEQLMSFQSNLFLGSYQWYDRHRDMRLDIDNMSYEELLALEERMGNVSTAISEETLSKCIRKSIYLDNGNESEDDVNCSVCQEEYRVGEEIGKLDCEHRYHAGCIEQWLGLKNWCPICKKTVVAGGGAAPSSTSQFKQ